MWTRRTISRAACLPFAALPRTPHLASMAHLTACLHALVYAAHLLPLQACLPGRLLPPPPHTRAPPPGSRHLGAHDTTTPCRHTPRFCHPTACLHRIPCHWDILDCGFCDALICLHTLHIYRYHTLLLRVTFSHFFTSRQPAYGYRTLPPFTDAAAFTPLDTRSARVLPFLNTYRATRYSRVCLLVIYSSAAGILPPLTDTTPHTPHQTAAPHHFTLPTTLSTPLFRCWRLRTPFLPSYSTVFFA